MSDFFFSQNKCGISNKVEKIDFKFVETCDIAPTPPPIFDCTLPIIAREPEIPCPTFSAAGKIDVSYGGSGEPNETCPTTSYAKISVDRAPQDKCPPDNSCAFDVDLDISVVVPPPPCPQINIGEFKITTGFADQPCVINAPNRFEITSKFLPGIGCTDPGTCEFTVDLEIVVPLPRTPCPQIKVNTFKIGTIYNDECEPPPSKFTVTPVTSASEGCISPDNCKNILDSLGLTLQQYERGRQLSERDKSDAQKEAELRCAEYENECRFEIDLEINVPIPRPPCPEIAVKKFIVGSSYVVDGVECERPNRFNITRKKETEPCLDPKKQDKCDFDVELEIFIPIPQPPCPKLNVKTLNVQTFYSDRQISKTLAFVYPSAEELPEVGTKDTIYTTEDDNKFFKWDGARREYVEIPRDDSAVLVYPDREAMPAEGVDGKIYKTANDNKFYRWEVDDNAYIEIPDCGGDSKFEITTTVTPSTECDKPNDCAFDFELDVFIPLPMPPCPRINVGEFKITTGFAGQPCVINAQNRFEIVPKVVKGVGCNEPDKCDFTVDLEIVVPLPEIPCPKLNVKTLNVQTFYSSRQISKTRAFVYPSAEELPEVGTKDTIYTTEDDNKFFKWDATKNDYVEIPRDDSAVLVYPDREAMPAEGVDGKIYKTANDNKFYRWEVDDNAYIEIPDCGGDSKFEITTTVTPSDKCDQPDNCAFDFELDVLIPLPMPPCPAIKVGKFTVESKYSDCVTEENTSKFEIVPKVVKGVGCNEPDKCDFTVDLSIVVPIPRTPCPTLNVKAFNVQTFYSDRQISKTNALVYANASKLPPVGTKDTIYTTADDNKFFNWDATNNGYVEIPRDDSAVLVYADREAMPTAGAAGATYKTVNNNKFYRWDDKSYIEIPDCGGDPKFEITTTVTPSNSCNQPDDCTFDFELDVFIPLPMPPCPAIKVGKFTVESKYSDCVTEENTSKFEIVPKVVKGVGCNEPDKCEFELNLEILVPIPKPLCPTFTITKFDVKSFYNTEDCNVGPSVFKVTQKPGASADCEDPPKCDFDIELEINVPIPLPPPCPEIRVGFFNVNYVENITADNIDKLYSGNRFVIKSSKEKNDCGDTSNCVFDFDVNINIPIPQCPFFNVNSFIVKSGFADCVAGAENKFNITQKPNKCEFDVDLEIVIPIPRTPCPVFGTNLSIRPFFFGGNCIPGQPPPVCPFGGGGGGQNFGANSWFTVEPIEIGGCCDQGDAQVVCGFLFDLNIAIPLPKLIQEVTFEPQKIKFDLFWCTVFNEPGAKCCARADDIVRWDFKAQVDPWLNCCDRGAKAEFKPELEIKYGIPRWPCNYIDLWPDENGQKFQIETIDSKGKIEQLPYSSYLKLKVVPQPPLDPCQPCRWEIIPELRIPKFSGECDKIRFKLDTATSGIVPFLAPNINSIINESAFEIEITQDDSDPCLYNIRYYLKIGVLGPICYGDVYVNSGLPGTQPGDLGTGTLKCESVTDSDGNTIGQKYRIDINLNTTKCSTSSTGSSGTSGGSSGTSGAGSTLPFTAAPPPTLIAQPQTKTIQVVTDVQLVDGKLNLTYDTVTVLAD